MSTSKPTDPPEDDREEVIANDGGDDGDVSDLLKELDPGDQTPAHLFMEGSESRPVGATMHLDALPAIQEGIQKERQRNKEKELDREGRTGSPGQPPPTLPDREYPEGVPIDHPIYKICQLVLDTLRPQINRLHRKCPDIFPFREDIENALFVEVGVRLWGEKEVHCKNTLELYDLASRSLNSVRNQIRKEKRRRSSRRRRQIGKELKDLGLEHGSGNIKSLDNSSAPHGENLAAGDFDPANAAIANEIMERYDNSVDKMDPELRQIFDLFTLFGDTIKVARIDAGLDKKDSSTPDCRSPEERPSLSKLAEQLKISKTTAHARLKRAFEQLIELMWGPGKSKPGV